jgi:hypothetical protein
MRVPTDRHTILLRRDGSSKRAFVPSMPRFLALAVTLAAAALVALPSSVLADHRVPPPVCPSEVTLQGVERAPGGVILVGSVVAATPDIGRVQLAVEAWYHRSAIPGLVPGELPATIDVVLGPRLSLTGRTIVAHLPQVGSRFVVAGTWPRLGQGVSIACGVFANVNEPGGEMWLERADALYLAVAPTPAGRGPGIPLDAPWFVLGAGTGILVLLAMVLGAVAQARDPAPAV